MGKEDILNGYIKLIDKGYCEDCNELNCIGNFPHKKIASAICDLQFKNTILEQQLKKKEEIIEKVIEYIKETSIGSILEVHCGCEEDYIEPLLSILEDKEVE